MDFSTPSLVSGYTGCVRGARCAWQVLATPVFDRLRETHGDGFEAFCASRVTVSGADGMLRRVVV